MRRLLKLGYEITICNNGRECVDLYKKTSTGFDLILMDVQMPILDGRQATEEIREFESSRMKDAGLPLSHKLNQNRIPILAVSASVYDSDVGECVKVGMDGFVNKPVNIKLMDSLIKSCIHLEDRKKLLMSKSERNEGAWFEFDQKI